ncbi:hypothetical protein IPA_07180 [Ignicoccus pacificus DSM 13166]|uniref:Dockerin domain-containing protein n=1 Tax=Ignicoccus pacificus DSM 13166 TaxID=940294 RepID=A0A977PL43_9CREN|nr:hypothetical protein IPA_07180 [Ignicoccus pacificus DSM 13166]
MIGTYTFEFYGRGLVKIVDIKVNANLFKFFLQTTPAPVQLKQNVVRITYQGLMVGPIPLGYVKEMVKVKFKVVTDVPPRYQALRNILGPLADKLFMMCTITPNFALAAKTVGGTAGFYLANNIKSFFFFAIAPYNVVLKPGDTFELVYFLSTTPSVISLYGRRALSNQCKWGGPWLSLVPDVYNFGGLKELTLRYGFMIPDAVKPKGYWDIPKNSYVAVNIGTTFNYPDVGTWTPSRSPSGLMTVPPIVAPVYITYTQAQPPFPLKLPATIPIAVLQTVEVGFQRKCPGDVDLDGKYTLRDFEVVACLAKVLSDTKFCKEILDTLPPHLVNLATLLGDVDSNGVLNNVDALVLLNMIGQKCPYADYAQGMG